MKFLTLTTKKPQGLKDKNMGDLGQLKYLVPLTTSQIFKRMNLMSWEKTSLFTKESTNLEVIISNSKCIQRSNPNN